MNLEKLPDIKSTFKNQLCLYTLTMENMRKELRKQYQRYLNQKGKVKLYLFSDNTILYEENLITHKHTKKNNPLELINEFRKVARYKINI